MILKINLFSLSFRKILYFLLTLYALLDIEKKKLKIKFAHATACIIFFTKQFKLGKILTKKLVMQFLFRLYKRQR